MGGNNYNGTLTSTAGTTDRFGNANGATVFTSGSSVGSLPLSLVSAVGDDFTLGFWFQTTMTAPSGTQWFQGAALVDAEMCGVTTDWGVALIDGGKVSFGIGSPDITIKSPANYNNGNWHFVTITRNKTAGTITLYMAGVQVVTTSGTTTAALSAPSSIRLASNPCAPTGVYTGAIDDIVLYNRVLSASEVTSLYNQLNAFVLPLRWVSFAAYSQNSHAVLKWEVESVVNNDRFEVEHSTDGNVFSKKGSIADGDGIRTGGQTSYTFLDKSAARGNNWYRIRQVDRDGKFTFSKSINLNLDNRASGFQLGSNPAKNDLVIINKGQLRISQVQISDLSGRLVLNTKMQSTGNVTLTGTGSLKPGYYLLRVVNAGGEWVAPWVKQ